MNLYQEKLYLIKFMLENGYNRAIDKRLLEVVKLLKEGANND